MGLKGIRSDTGSEFINRPVDLWCLRHGGDFSRDRPTRKNDNCSVEQKNYAAVRKIGGCFRAPGAAALQTVYDAYNSPLNLYSPRMKQISWGKEKKKL
jgi:hypothetical protein